MGLPGFEPGSKSTQVSSDFTRKYFIIKALNRVRGTLPKYSGIDKHKRKGKRLIAPLNTLPVHPMNWQRDVLPEYLWIEFLKQAHPNQVFLDLYSDFCTTLRSYCEGNLAFLGLISDFDRIPEKKRVEILTNHKASIDSAFVQPFGKVIMSYPEAPCYWMLSADWIQANQHSQKEAIVELTQTTERLLRSKDSYCAYLRMIPIRRLLEEDKIRFMRGLEIIDLLPKYPHGLNEEDRLKCESMGRSLLGTILPHYINVEWAKYFWRKNFELSPCQIKKEPIGSQKILSKKASNKLELLCNSNNAILLNYLDNLMKNYKFDLYSPEKDEVVLGLFSRITRLSSIIHENSTLWSFDLSRIMLRCLSDTVITFCYLINEKNEKLFDSFIDYGKGKEKLILLHLQDTHPKELGPSGETTEIIADQLGGGFSPSLIDINLGDWTNTSARDMAKVCGLLDIYRVIYDPTSSDVHGTWTSIRNVNLTYCTNPLHRFHRLPQMEAPPFFLQPLHVTVSLFQKSIEFAQKHWNFPAMQANLETFDELEI